MAKLVWDKTGERLYETGTDHGVLYPMATTGEYEKGVAWNGLTGVSEAPSGAEATALYADDQKYLNLLSAEEFAATIEAYTYPEEFEACDGSGSLTEGITVQQQSRKKFGLAYRTRVGNDVNGSDYGYKIHLVYNCLASPSQKDYSTINDSPEAVTFSWEVSTEKVEVEGMKPTATLIIDSTKIDASKLSKIEEKLFGSATEEPTLLLPDEVLALVKGA